MTVQFQLLGDAAAYLNGQPVDVGHARQRCVLAVLLVDANRVVPVDQLLERVWGERLPQRARNVLSGYLSRLRLALADAGGVRITRQPGGYQLTVDPAAVDLHRFYELTKQARQTSDADAAAAALEQALAQWQGPAFGALNTPWLNTLRDNLDGRRLAAVLDRNDDRLRRGGHAELLDDMATLAAAHPLDERLAGQLILALYRCGRQADALHQYQQLRTRLADELGADPSPALQLLHQQILTADPALAVSQTANTTPAFEAPPAAPTLVVPRQLPAPPRTFSARTAELATLDTVLDTVGDQPSAMVISAVSGTAGVGKTALALHWAHLRAHRFPDGQLYVNLRGFDPTGSAMDPAEVIRAFLDALGVPPQRVPATEHAQAGLYRSLLAGKQMLVLLDNARDVAQVRPLLPGAPGCLALITCRNQLTGLVAAEGAHPLTLDLLTTIEARQLLTDRLGPDRVAACPAAVDQVITRCARLPLALSIVAAHAATRPDVPLDAMAAQLADGLDAFDGDDPANNVRAVFSWSCRALSPQAYRLFRLVGLHPGPDIAAPAAASLAGTPATQFRAALVELTRAHLLTEHTPGRYTFHDLLRVYATEQVQIRDSEPRRRHAVHRLLDHYLHTAHAADRILDPHRSALTLAPPQPGVTLGNVDTSGPALAWLTAERQNLLDGIRLAYASGFDAHTWQLAWIIASVLSCQGQWHDWAATQHTALAAAQRIPDPAAQAHARRGLARAYTRLGRLDDAGNHLQHALKLYEALADHAGQGHAHLGIAWILERRHHYAQSLRHAEQALKLFRQANHRAGQARALNAVGWYHVLLGHLQFAITYGHLALSLSHETGDRFGQVTAWHVLGTAHHRQGRHATATDCYHRALDMYGDLTDGYYEAVVLTNLAEAHWRAGDHEAARTARQRALAILDGLEHPDAGTLRAKLYHASRTTAAAHPA